MVSLSDIQCAAKILQGNVLRTPLVYSPTFSKMTGTKVYLKLENLQKGGSFKIRGATYKIKAKRDQIRPEGVVAASIGNHAQAWPWQPERQEYLPPLSCLFGHP